MFNTRKTSCSREVVFSCSEYGGGGVVSGEGAAGSSGGKSGARCELGDINGVSCNCVCQSGSAVAVNMLNVGVSSGIGADSCMVRSSKLSDVSDSSGVTAYGLSCSIELGVSAYRLSESSGVFVLMAIGSLVNIAWRRLWQSSKISITIWFVLRW